MVNMYLFLLILSQLLRHVVCERVIALSGTEVPIFCHSSTSSPVLWSRITRNSADEVDIASGTGVTREFASKFSAQRTSEHDHILTLLVASVDDSGNYSCIEDEGLSERRYTSQLIVQERLTRSNTDISSTPAPTGIAAWPVPAIVIVSLTVGALLAVFVVLIVRAIIRDRNKDPRPDSTNGNHEMNVNEPENGGLLISNGNTGQTTNIRSPSNQRPNENEAENDVLLANSGSDLQATSTPRNQLSTTTTDHCCQDPHAWPKLKRSVTTELRVAAVACSSSAADGSPKICIAFHDSQTIMVVDSPELEITITGLKSVVDMTGCLCVNGLYVADSGNNCIWRTAPGLGEVNCLQLEASPTGLSIRRSAKNRGDLLVSTMSNVLMYDCNMQLLNKILLPDDVIPLHLIQTPAGNFVVCHAGGITEFGIDGAVKHSFVGDLCSPCHLALNSKDGGIFVADMHGGRVLLLTSDLQLVEDFVLGEGKVTTPNRLCYVAKFDQLIVGEAGHKTVKLFALSKGQQPRACCAAEHAK